MVTVLVGAILALSWSVRIGFGIAAFAAWAVGSEQCVRPG